MTSFALALALVAAVYVVMRVAERVTRMSMRKDYQPRPGRRKRRPRRL